MDPSSGRFPSMDSFAGYTMDPASLHKYTLNHNDPINRIDPSGNTSLVEVSIATDVNATLRTTAVATGRNHLKSVLFGHPPKDIGVVGEMVLDWMLQGFFDHIQDGGITKQEFGQRVNRPGNSGGRLV